MKPRKSSVPGVSPVPPFDAQVFLESAGGPRAVVKFERGETVFRQGDAGKDVFYIQSGGVKLSVLSRTGKEAVVAMIGPGDFFGEGCMAGQSSAWAVRRRSAERHAGGEEANGPDCSTSSRRWRTIAHMLSRSIGSKRT